MATHAAAYQLLTEQLLEQGVDVEQVKAALKRQVIETPSWGYANSGTRFRSFPWPGAAVTTRQKLADAAMVHKMTGIAPSVAVHIPWDVPEDQDYDAMGQYARSLGIRIGAVNPNVFQDDEYRLGSLGNPDRGIQEQALDHMIECCAIMGKVGSSALSLWFADGTNYAGQDSLRARKRRFEDGLTTLYRHLPAGGRMLIEYKFFEPAFYSTDIPDWGTAYAWATTRRASTSSRSSPSCSTRTSWAASISTTASMPTTTSWWAAPTRWSFSSSTTSWQAPNSARTKGCARRRSMWPT
jgi:L-rhamnose isomerase/sugar isomerase